MPSSAPTICIGVHTHAEPERLRATLASLCRYTAPQVKLLLLPDGPDAATVAALARLADLPQLGTPEARGTAACFNRLAAASDADVLVLLESGALVGPGWLDHLLAALAADPRNGLAGPSTNRAWNEQAVFPDAGGTPAEVARVAQEARRRFGAAARTLEPLYSLGDFCYVVRREVIAAVGAADEGYGNGPCWEMDYNIRAARAGFRGVWVGAAYVWRAPFTARRRQMEATLFEAGKRRYQDAFCALRRRGERSDYEPHCRGDACEHFAPPALIQVALPLARPAAVAPAPPPAPEEPPASAGGPPLVSCIMPTRNRPDFALQAIAYFQRQDYPARELIILDDGGAPLTERLPADPRIRYVRLEGDQSIGAKRNRGCELARGSIIAHWDDDDWYAPDRLSAQIAPLLAGAAEISALTAGVFFDLPRWEFWRCTTGLHRRLFVEDVHGGTLVYWRRVWERQARYPDRSLAEDAVFLRQAMRHGARLHRQAGDALFVYLRHAANSWAFVCGQYLDPRGWLRVGEPLLPETDRAFYAARSAAQPPAPAPAPRVTSPTPDLPLVSCIMPTGDRRAFVAQAIHYFLRQDYPNRELLILDDGSEPVADLAPTDPRIRYVALDSRMILGAKRNLACRLARGSIIAHWDDDDWIAPQRLRYQVTHLLNQGADVCGAHCQIYYDPRDEQAWLYAYPPALRRWLAGNTLCYRKDFWAGHPFAELAVGEDTHFLWSRRDLRAATLPDHTFYVGLVHPGNTSPKRTDGTYWRPYPVAEVHRLLGADLLFYRSLAAGRGPAPRAPHQREMQVAGR